MDPLPNNTRYILELERQDLLKEKHEFDETYGTFSFAFITSFQTFALLAYLYTTIVLIAFKKSHSKINTIISLWALINFLVLFENISRAFGIFDDVDIRALSEMVGGLERSYGTMLGIVWLYLKYVGQPKAKYDYCMYSLISMPACICLGFIFHYFFKNKFISEVYGPGSDILNVTVYLIVLFIYLFCKLFKKSDKIDNPYPGLVALVNLITNFPRSLIKIYFTFVLDISWTYRYQIYFLKFFVDIISSSSAFVVLFLVFLYNEHIRGNSFRQKSKVSYEQPTEQVKMMTQDYC